MMMTFSFTSHRILLPALVLTVAIAGLLFALPAYAQAPTFYNMNAELVNQAATIPDIIKKMTILIGVLTTYVGIHGFYKGSADPRSAAPVKNMFLLIVGGMLLGFSFLALSAEKTVFGSNYEPRIRGSRLLNNNMEAFR